MNRNIFGQLFALFITVFGLLFFIFALVSTYEKMQDNEMSSIELTCWLIALLGIISLIAYISAMLLSRKLYIILLVGIAFLLRICWAYWIKTPIVSDFNAFYSGAVNIANGDYQFSESPYFQRWTYQLGFSSYEAIIISLFGESTLALKLLNIFYSVGTCLIVYLTASKVFNELSGRIAGLISAFYLPSIVMCSVLTNQHLSTFLYFLALYLIINNGFSKKYSWISIGLLIGFGNIIRPLGSMVLLAIAVYIVILFLLRGNKQTYISITKKFVGIIAIYFLIQKIVSYTIIGIGITDNTLENKDTLWKFVIGFNHETKGKYSALDGQYLEQFSLWEERNEKAKELIEERLSDKGKVLRLMERKFVYMWGEKDSSVHWSLIDLDFTEEFVENLYKIERIMFLSILTFSLIGFLSIIFWRQELNMEYLLFLIFLLGYVAVHFLIEVQTRYRFDIMPVLMIIQGYGVFAVITRMKSLLSKNVVTNHESQSRMFL